MALRISTLVNAMHAQYGICNVVCKLVNRRPVIPQNDSWVVSVAADMLGGRMDDVVTCSNVVIVDMSVIVDSDVVTSAEEEEVDDEAAVSEEKYRCCRGCCCDCCNCCCLTAPPTCRV